MEHTLRAKDIIQEGQDREERGEKRKEMEGEKDRRRKSKDRESSSTREEKDQEREQEDKERRATCETRRRTKEKSSKDSSTDRRGETAQGGGSSGERRGSLDPISAVPLNQLSEDRYRGTSPTSSKRMPSTTKDRPTVCDLSDDVGPEPRRRFLQQGYNTQGMVEFPGRTSQYSYSGIGRSNSASEDDIVQVQKFNTKESLRYMHIDVSAKRHTGRSASSHSLPTTGESTGEVCGIRGNPQFDKSDGVESVTLEWLQSIHASFCGDPAIPIEDEQAMEIRLAYLSGLFSLRLTHGIAYLEDNESYIVADKKIVYLWYNSADLLYALGNTRASVSSTLNRKSDEWGDVPFHNPGYLR
jgi:hypothetical protein